MRKRKSFLWSLVFISIMFSSNHSMAEDKTAQDAINAGRAYLLDSRNDDGTWSDSPRTFIDTVEAGYALHYIGFVEPNPPEAFLSKTLNWVFDYEVAQDDYLARRWRMVVRISASEDDPFDEDEHDTIFQHIHEESVSLQNPDGGWGITYRYESDPYGTLLTLEALAEAHARLAYSDTTIFESGFSYLLSQQQDDGSWTFTEEEDGNLSLTASIVSLLSRYSQSNTFSDQEFALDVSTARGEGAEWISGFRQSDGGYWMTKTNAAESSLALFALLENNYSPGYGLNAFTYLLDNQIDTNGQTDTDGSWEGDPYTTALAVRALEFAKSMRNLGVDADNIVLLTDPAITGAPAEIDVGVENLGGITLSDVRLDVYDGDPDGATQPGWSKGVNFEREMDPGATGYVKFTMPTVGRLGSQEVFAVVDEPGGPVEIDETNNKASMTFDIVLPAPSDFSADGGYNTTVDLSWTPLDIPDLVPSAIRGYNIYRDGDEIPINGPTPIPQPGSPLPTTYVDDSGLNDGQEYSYTISSVDVDYIEGPLSDPIIGVPIPPVIGTDLTAFVGELTFSPASGNATINETITINCVVRNLGTDDVSGFVVDFYDGHPSGGQLIEGEPGGFLGARSSVGVVRTWNPNTAGTRQVYVVIDPYDAIEEDQYEGNNQINKPYTVNSIPNLSIGPADIEVFPGKPLLNDLSALVEGRSLLVEATLHNIGGTESGSFDVQVLVTDSNTGDVDSYTTMVGNIPAGQTRPLVTPDIFTLTPGDHTVQVVLDVGNVVDDAPDADNEASAPFHVMTQTDLVISNMELAPPPSL